MIFNEFYEIIKSIKIIVYWIEVFKDYKNHSILD